MKNFYRTKGAYFLGVILSAMSCVYTIAALNWLGYTINISFHALIGGVIVGLSLACIVWISTWIGSDESLAYEISDKHGSRHCSLDDGDE